MISITGENTLSNFYAANGITIASFPGPSVSNGRVYGLLTIASSRSAVSNIVCDSLSVTGLENSIANITIEAGGSCIISAIRNTVTSIASASAITLSGDQGNYSNIFSFTNLTLSADFCSLNSIRVVSGGLLISGDQNTISQGNISGGIIISGTNNKIVGMDVISGSTSITGPNTNLSNSTPTSTTTIDVATATNCILTGNNISGLSVINGGGGIASDPLLVGNRVNVIPVDIAPASTGNQI